MIRHRLVKIKLSMELNAPQISSAPTIWPAIMEIVLYMDLLKILKCLIMILPARVDSSRKLIIMETPKACVYLLLRLSIKRGHTTNAEVKSINACTSLTLV